MSYGKTTKEENIKDLKRTIVMLNAEMSYYLGLAQQKLDDIDELDRVIYDLEHEDEPT